ncbi:response regulator transcription factor [Streptomyces chartreusis]|uniref:response regulator transcription factor n=1 Tax=Streptomyces chartreusis TaxID=1969 RepID=UPI00371531B6
MRIKIIDEGNLLSGALRAALDTQPFLTIALERARPDIIVSSQASESNDIEPLLATRQEHPEIPALIVTERVRPIDIRRILTTGAAGILHEKTATQHISWAIPAILKGCRVLSPEVSEALISEYLGSQPTTPQENSARERVHRLSQREQEVLHLLSRGMPNREIARHLFISPETVKDHVRAVRSKLDAPTRVHAAHVAWLARGITAATAA